MPPTDLPSGDEKTQFVRTMFDEIAGRYELVNRLMTLGLDRRWRRRAIADMQLHQGQTVLDLGCGTGDLTRVATDAGLICYGIDLSFGMLRAASRFPSALVEADAGLLPISSGSVDGVVSGFALRNFSDQNAVFAEIARVLRPDGRISILEVDRPKHLVVRIGHHVWFNFVVPRIGAAFSVASAYRYLPKSIAYLPTPERLQGMLIDAGFHDVRRVQLQGGLAQIVTATLNKI